jgi:uncharacterized protein YfaT (DUF1175 family)
LSTTGRVKFLAVVTVTGAAIVCAWAVGTPPQYSAAVRLPLSAVPPPLELSPAHIWADGYDSATLSVQAPAGAAALDNVLPRVTLSGTLQAAAASEPQYDHGKWQVQIRAGVMPGPVAIRVEVPGRPPASTSLTVDLSESDAHEDGTPDFLRLDDAADQQAFRRWFTYLAEAQYFQDPANRPPEIDDCAALIRYAYREALHAHNNAWTASARLPLIPAMASIAKYDYPHTALGAALFRNRDGSFRAADLNSGAFTQFADVKTLWRFNTYSIGRHLDRAQPGDLLFYRQPHDGHPPTFHSMIFLGASQIRPDAQRYVVYHTGPQQSAPQQSAPRQTSPHQTRPMSTAGELRRLSLEELRRFPEPEWRPDPGNPAFLGVYRWNILRSGGLKPGEVQP